MSTSLSVMSLVTCLLGCAGAWGDKEHRGEPENQPPASGAHAPDCANAPDEVAPADTTAAEDDQLNAPGSGSSEQLGSINGFDVADPEQALDAFKRLRTPPCVQVELNRRGEPTNLEININ